MGVPWIPQSLMVLLDGPLELRNGINLDFKNVERKIITREKVTRTFDGAAVGWMKRRKSEMVYFKGGISEWPHAQNYGGSQYFDTPYIDELNLTLLKRLSHVVYALHEFQMKAIESCETKNGWFFQERNFSLNCCLEFKDLWRRSYYN